MPQAFKQTCLLFYYLFTCQEQLPKSYLLLSHLSKMQAKGILSMCKHMYIQGCVCLCIYLYTNSTFFKTIPLNSVQLEFQRFLTTNMQAISFKKFICGRLLLASLLKQMKCIKVNSTHALSHQISKQSHIPSHLAPANINNSKTNILRKA